MSGYCERCYRHTKWWANICGICRWKERVADSLAAKRKDA